MIIVKPIVKKVVNNQKEKLELCLNFVSDPGNRKIMGLVIMGLGIGVIGIGGGLIASAFVKLPE